MPKRGRTRSASQDRVEVDRKIAAEKRRRTQEEKRRTQEEKRREEEIMRRKATENMRRENLKTSRINFQGEQEHYEFILDVLKRNLNSKNIREQISRPSAEFDNFLREVDKLPREESDVLKEALYSLDITSVKTILSRYIERFKRLIDIDRRYSCTDLYYNDLFYREEDKDKTTNNKRILAMDFWVKNKETDDKTKADIYNRFVHTDMCNELHKNKPNRCQHNKLEMSQCLQRRICGNALVYNNIPENFDIGHCNEATKLDCDKSMYAYQEENDKYYQSIHLLHKSGVPRCRFQPN